MKNFRVVFPVLGFMLILGFAGCKSQASSWSKEQKDTWTTNCMKLMNDRGVAQKDATALCDCMLQKTSAKYTPGEAEKITVDQERQLWQECDYQW